MHRIRDRHLLLGGWILILILAPTAVRAETLTPAQAIEEARSKQDWSTLAETALRWWSQDPSRHNLLGEIATARLYRSELDACENWLNQWIATAPEPSSAMLALRGELAYARNDRSTARAAWEQSYERAPSEAVARRLLDSTLYSPSERGIYESYMHQIAKNYQYHHALAVSAEAHFRDRDWKSVEAAIKQLQALRTQAGLAESARLENAVKRQTILSEHDAAVLSEDAALGLARRAHFFFQRHLHQLATPHDLAQDHLSALL